MSKQRFYVHFEENELSFIAFHDSYTTIASVLEDTAVRLQNAHPAEHLCLKGHLNRLCSVGVIEDKSDVFVVLRREEDAEEVKLEGNKLFEKGRFDEAIEMYSKAAALDPENPVVLLNRSLALMKVKQWRKAEESARLAVGLDEESVKARYRLGQALFGQQKFAEALDVLSAALELDGLTAQQAHEIGTLIGECEENGAGKDNVSEQDSVAAVDARLPVTAYLKLKPFFAIAQEAAKERRFAHAIAIYRKILDIHNDDFTSLKGLAKCLLDNKSHKYAECKTVLEKLVKLYGDSDEESWRLLGECQLQMERPELALQSFGKASKLTKVPEVISLIKVKISACLLLQKKIPEALHFVSEVLLGEENHPEALLQYGAVMLEQQNGEEALKVALRLLVSSPADRETRKFLCQVLRRNGMVAALLETLTFISGKIEANSFSFLAGVAKEYSAIDASVTLFRNAVESSNWNAPGFVLSLVHVLEIDCRIDEALQVVELWLQKNPSLCCGPEDEKKISAQQVLGVWQGAKKVEFTAPQLNEEFDYGKPEWASVQDLDFLAVLFALVKMLFIQGRLGEIPPLVSAIEKVREGWDFHATKIRNENAFYCCAAMCLKWHTSPCPLKDCKKLFVVGDSHCLSSAWRQVQIRNEHRVLVPLLATGCKLWHLRPEGSFFPKHNFHKAVERIPDASEDVVFVLGEIDCREGLLVCIEKGRYDSLEEGVQTVIRVFVQVLLEVKRAKKFKNIWIHPVVPVLDPTRHIVHVFNRQYRLEVEKQGFQWLDIYEELLEVDEKQQCGYALKKGFDLDGTHLNPSYTELFKFPNE